MNPQIATAYTSDINPRFVRDEQTALFNLDMDDEKLVKMVVRSLDSNIGYWEKAPFLLSRTDSENMKYLLGDQVDANKLNPNTQTRYVDNRLHSGIRAILSYATGRPAKPSLSPSKTDDKYKRMARNMQSFLYQHVVDHDVNLEMRLGLKNLISRKRAVIKLRFDEDYGPFGDIISENIDPSDIVVDQYAGFRDNPNKIYHRQQGTIEELCAKFPDKQEEIYTAFGFKRGVFTQLTRMVTYWECWFTYYDDKYQKCEGVCWFLPKSNCILGKMKNPNWLYKGSTKNQKIVNILNAPPKPFVFLNYLNSGRSFIDETCLMDQAVPMQDILNKRGRQLAENSDYANGRTLIDKRVMEQADAQKFINKHPRTIGLIDTTQTNNDINKAVLQLPVAQLPSYVMQDKVDARNEIYEMLGVNPQFMGSQIQQTKNPTLGQDLMANNKAQALQDDLVGVMNQGYKDYYHLLLQLCTVYLNDDYWIMTKGYDGQYVMIQLHDENLDTNVRMTVETDSTLPLDKQALRATAIQLLQMNKIDELSAYEMIGLPDPEKLVERHIRSVLDPYTYMESIEQKMFSAEAEADIALVTLGKKPEDRDDYSERYFGHWNLFMASNRFQRLNLGQQQRLTDFLHQVANKAAISEGLRDSMLSPAGILDRSPLPPMPKRDLRIIGQLSPEASQTMAGLPPQQAVGGSAPQSGQAPPNAAPQPGSNQGSPPRMVNPSQFGH
jgi:hypothetical protein